jgi:RimJ/RimL family protein N-acetyltransferase
MGIDGHCLSARLGWHITQGAEIGHWVAERVQGKYFADGSQAIGLERDGQIIAGVIYENWNKASIVCHIAIEGRITKGYLRAIFSYPFEFCKVKKIIVPVSSTHAKSLKLVTKMGFSEEARVKDAVPDGDIIFLTLAQEKCRFLGVENG